VEFFAITGQTDDALLHTHYLLDAASGNNTCLLEPTAGSPLNGLSIRSAIFAGLTNVIDRGTDRPTALLRVIIGRYRQLLVQCGLITMLSHV